MHTSTELRREHFTITVACRPADFETLFPGFTDEDRLGIVIGEDWAGAGASTDFFAFHVGRLRGTLGMLDVWPEHKEVVVDPEAEQILEAINDRGVTRLLVEETIRGEPEFHPYTRASAERRIKTALSYSPDGRARDPDVTVTGSARTESYVEAMLAEAAPEVRRGRGGSPRRRQAGGVLPADQRRAGAATARLPYGLDIPNTVCAKGADHCQPLNRSSSTRSARRGGRAR